MHARKITLALMISCAMLPLVSSAENDVQALASAASRSDEPAPAAPLYEITVTEPIKMGERPYYNGSDGFALAGAVGVLIAQKAWKGEPERIAAFVSQEKIDIADMVKEEFEKQVNARQEFIDAYKALGSAHFSMFMNYGITDTPFGKYLPYVTVHARLVDADGKIKWKNYDTIGRNGDAPSIAYEDFYKSADVFKGEFRIAIKEVVTSLLKSFHQ